LNTKYFEWESLTSPTEIIGTAVKVGPKVTTVKVGDRVGVGAQISACLDCTQCNEGNETYCKKQQGKSWFCFP
jgi:alcohol dehydrogenase (NADP+)